MKKIILFFILLCFIPSVCFSDWKTTLESNFDWVETFIQYDDWQPTETTTSLLYDENFDGVDFDGPVITGASDSDWNTYGTWDIVAPAVPIIQDHGSTKRVTDKSMMVGYNAKSTISTYEGDVGVFKTMIYFGDGNPAGYSDMYFFTRVFIPENYFPTSVAGVGTDFDTVQGDDTTVAHVDGHQPAEMTSHKWISFGTGFLNTRDWRNVDTETTCMTYSSPLCPSGPYGGNEIWLHLKNKTFDSVYSITPKLERYDGGYQETWGTAPVGSYFGKMVGLEVHLKVETTAGTSNDGVAECWFYDENGTATQFFSSSARTFLKVNQDGTGFNRLWFVGNIRVRGKEGADLYYNCGEGMDCVTYFDDLIINDTRIGPTYYNLLNGESTPGRAILGAGKPANLGSGVIVNLQ